MSLVKEIVELIDSKQGCNIQVLNMQKVSFLMDYMVITHVSNPRLMSALADYVLDFLDEKNIEVKPVKKGNDSRWILIDAKDIIIHIFLEEERIHYSLEKLWKDCLVDIETLV